VVTSIAINADERAALIEVVEAQLGTLNDVWVHSVRKDWAQAEEAFRHHTQDCRLLEDLRDSRQDDGEEFRVNMWRHELRETLTRVMARRTSRLAVEEARGFPSPEQEAYQENAGIALLACERCLKLLRSRYEIRYVVADTETGDPEGQPTATHDFALDLCELLNEKAVLPPADRD
jgi:hypothetical protein